MPPRSRAFDTRPAVRIRRWAPCVHSYRQLMSVGVPKKLDSLAKEGSHLSRDRDRHRGLHSNVHRQVHTDMMRWRKERNPLAGQTDLCWSNRPWLVTQTLVGQRDLGWSNRPWLAKQTLAGQTDLGWSGGYLMTFFLVSRGRMKRRRTWTSMGRPVRSPGSRSVGALPASLPCPG